MPCQPPRPHPRPPELPRATQRVKKDLLLYTVFIKSVPASTTPVKKYVSYLLGEPPAPPHQPPSLCPPTPPRCPPWREMSPRTSARLGDPNGTDRRTDRPVAGEGCRLGGAHHPGIRGCVRDSSSKASPPPHPPTHPPSRPQATLPRAPQPAPRGARGARGAPGSSRMAPAWPLPVAKPQHLRKPAAATPAVCVSPSHRDRDSPWGPGLTAASRPPESSGACQGSRGAKGGAGSEGTGTAGDRAVGWGTAQGWPPAPQTLPSGLWCQRRTGGCP